MVLLLLTFLCEHLLFWLLLFRITEVDGLFTVGQMGFLNSCDSQVRYPVPCYGLAKALELEFYAFGLGYLLVNGQIVEKFRVWIWKACRNVTYIVLVGKWQLEWELKELLLCVIRLNYWWTTIIYILPSFWVPALTFLSALNQRKEHRSVSLSEERVFFSLNK